MQQTIIDEGGRDMTTLEGVNPQMRNQGVGECNHFLHQFHVLHLLVWTDLGRLSTNGAQEAKGGKTACIMRIMHSY